MKPDAKRNIIILNSGNQKVLTLFLVKDLRSNPRLTPLLPFLVNFSRVCLSRYKENSLITSRITRLVTISSSIRICRTSELEMRPNYLSKVAELRSISLTTPLVHRI